jgi:hypothetical protein
MGNGASNHQGNTHSGGFHGSQPAHTGSLPAHGGGSRPVGGKGKR